MSIMATQLLILGLAAAAPPEPAAPPKAQMKDWEAAIRPLPRDEMLFDWLYSLDLRPTAAFTKFTDERLEPWVAMESAHWFGIFFKDAANPFKHKVAGPTRYSLAPTADRRSLLMYEWRTDRYDFTILEAAHVVMLRVKPLKKPLASKAKPIVKDGAVMAEAESPERIARILKQLLSKRVVGDPFIAYNFGMTASDIEVGHVYTNGRPLQYLPPEDWAKNVMVFQTDDDLCVLLAKAWPNLPIFIDSRNEADWLPTALSEKDGKSLVIDRLWGRPYPRPSRVRTNKAGQVLPDPPGRSRSSKEVPPADPPARPGPSPR
jgi:hypothetical protein